MDLLQGLLSKLQSEGKPIPGYLSPASMGGLLPNPPPVPFSADERVSPVSLLPPEKFNHAVLEGDPQDRPAYIMSRVEKYAPSSKYKNAQQIFKGTIARETGNTFDPAQKQIGGLAKGLIQMEPGSFQHKVGNKTYSNRVKKPGRNAKYVKGMHDFYTEWLSSNKMMDNGENQIRFLMESLESKGKSTGYKVGNEEKILKALKGGNIEDGMAMFTKYAIRPSWANKKSISYIKKQPQFRKTMELSK